MSAFDSSTATGGHLCRLSFGRITKVSAFNPSEFAWRLGDRLSAESYLIAAPVYAPDGRTREALLTHPGIKEVFRRSENLDLAIVSVGDLSPTSTFVTYGLLEKEEMLSLQRAGAIGDILCRFTNAAGEVTNHEVNERVVAVDPRGRRPDCAYRNIRSNLRKTSEEWQAEDLQRLSARMLTTHADVINPDLLSFVRE
ncbi:DNA-binding transcriptional regulator LsrR (DeoR family) [Phyllobacterium sp. 1468]|nr:DNA-binding transcriptional regulator LsrR (DeoR family) [Phyllobacterium sp. 1468]